MPRSDSWFYYNFALLPKCAPHEQADVEAMQNRDFWKLTSAPAVLARWTENFDCARETSWWYVIKDTPFCIEDLKAKRRYEVRKGLKYFDVLPIDPASFVEELYDVQVDAYSVYPKKYRPSVDREKFQEDIRHNWGIKGTTVIGAFDRESRELCGYARLKADGRCIYFDSLKTRPAHEKKGLNAAIVLKVMEVFEEALANGAYICDGARNVQHETSFQDYLEKYFGFRKAYCTLCIAYNPKFRWLVHALYKLRGIFSRLDYIRLIHKLNGVLMMESIVREQEKQHEQ